MAGKLDFTDDKLPTLDCLKACRFDLYYRIAWRVQRNWLSHSCAAGHYMIASTGSVWVANFTVCCHSEHVLTYVCQLDDISPKASAPVVLFFHMVVLQMLLLLWAPGRALDITTIAQS